MVNSETKVCQNCKASFVIDASDFAFYEKVKVPPPTFCPECRQIRRVMWRNERGLHIRKCDAPSHEEKIVSVFSQNSPFKVYDQKYWWGDDYDPMEHGKGYDFSKPFFEQFKDIFQSTPQLALHNIMPVNTEYAQHATNNKNCYLVSSAGFNENVFYSNRIISSKDSMDIYLSGALESSYEVVNSGGNSYKLFFSWGCESCSDMWFSYDCRGCSDCFGCIGLRNKKYHIFNKQYTKEEYSQKIKEFNTGSYKIVEDLKKLRDELILKFPRKYIYTFYKTVNVVGDMIGQAKNCIFCFDGLKVENCKFSTWIVDGVKDTYDAYAAAYKSELLYEVSAAIKKNSRVAFSAHIFNSHSIQYSYNCHSSSNLFGCANLKNKQYCILNKQYTKEKYEDLIPKITQHMNDMPYIDKKGRVYKYGEFFPPELSPFAYNETIAQNYFPLTKEQAIDQGYQWRDPEERNYQVDIKSENLPDHIKDVNEDIIGKVIECAHKGECNEQCATVFKIIKEELQFYKKMNLPLPRLCPNCRHYQRLKQRNPLKLWHRQCMCDYQVYNNTVKHNHHPEGHCLNEFETSYAPDRPEIVYCEQCYNSEVV